MNLPFYIARRYLFSKKKHNAINIISGISVCGVALATLALVCTLSVFNGFQDMVAGFFTAFDPELKITIREGKVFEPQGAAFQEVRSLPEIGVWTETLEENAMVQYKDRQAMAIIKGVEDNFEELTSIDSLLYGAGEFILHDSIVDYGVLGVELISELGTGLQCACSRFLFFLYVFICIFDDPVQRGYADTEKLIQIIGIDAKKSQAFQKRYFRTGSFEQDTLIEIHPADVTFYIRALLFCFA